MPVWLSRSPSRWKGWKTRSRSAGGMPGPAVGDPQVDPVVVAARGYNGVIAGQALQDKISGIISSITQAAEQRVPRTVHMIVTTIGDPGHGETHEGESGVALHHRIRVRELFHKRGVKFRRLVVLAHDPRGGHAQLIASLL